MKNTQKGFSTTTALLLVIAVILIAGTAYWVYRPQEPVVPPTDGTSTDPNATSTPSTNGTSTPSTSTTTPPTAEETRLYSNSTLGISFNYPKDFLVRTEGFTADGAWQAKLTSGRGEIIVKTLKSNAAPSDTNRMNTQSIRIQNKDANLYDTRRDVCDVTVARTSYDKNYALEFSFSACGTDRGSIFKDRSDVVATLGSVKFLNTNSYLYVNTKLGFAFRYPITWTQPTTKTVGSNTVLTFGNDLEITTGAQYSKTLKKNMTYAEAAIAGMTASSTTVQKITVGDKDAQFLTTVPVSGPTKRAVYFSNKSATDLVIVKQEGVDSAGLDLVLSTFTFIK